MGQLEGPRNRFGLGYGRARLTVRTQVAWSLGAPSRGKSLDDELILRVDRGR